jgi:hypothetical protein
MLEAGVREIQRDDDPAAAAVATIRRRLSGNDHSARTLGDFIEDDLQQGLSALSELDDYFAELLSVLAGGGPPVELVASADDASVQRHLEHLIEVIASLRRRIGQYAARSAPSPSGKGMG